MKTFKHWLAESDERQFPLAVRIIIPNERFEGTAYPKPEKTKIPGRFYAYGYGSDVTPSGTPVRKGDTVTREDATKLMYNHINNVVLPSLQQMPNWDKMNANQQEAMISFAYNRGENFWKGEGAQKINQILADPSRWDEMPAAMAEHRTGVNKKTGKREVMGGLVDRRQEEGILWSTPVPEIPTSLTSNPDNVGTPFTDPEYLRRRQEEARAIAFENERRKQIPVETRRKHPLEDDQGRKLY